MKHLGKIIIGIVLLVGSYFLSQLQEDSASVDNTTIEAPKWTRDLDKIINDYNRRIDSLSRKRDSVSIKLRKQLIKERDQKAVKMIQENS